MMKIGIIDPDRNLVDTITGMLDTSMFEVVFRLENGTNALREIMEKKPEVLILNDVMPACSGFDVLTEIKRNKSKEKPHIIFTSNICNNIILLSLDNYGIDEYVVKPYDIRGMHDRLVYLHHYRKRVHNDRRSVLYTCEQNIRGGDAFTDKNALMNMMRSRRQLVSIISALVREFGISVKHDGFNYAAEGAGMIFDQKNAKMSLTKEVYPQIAKKFNVTAGTVEYGIRNAVRQAWEKMQERDTTANMVYNSFEKRPTNSEFLHMIAHLAEEKLFEEENVERSQHRHPKILI